MRRFLTTLMILLVVLVAGLSALVLLVNPNDFRAYMVQQVAARSEYQLQLDGPLRWHVWPQLSILSGRMTLTARGASEPLVRADNMRLDVALWPLLSHQLHVKQVMLKGGVIQLTPQTEAVRSDDAPVAPKDNTLPDVAEDRGWSFDIRSLRVADSVLVFQHENDDQVTVRDIRLNMEQDAEHRGTFDFSGRVNRDQRDLALSFSGTVDASDYPHNLTAGIEQLRWQLQGADLPAQGIEGQGQLQAQWQEAQKRLSFNHLNLTANDSSLTGHVQVTLAEQPEWQIDLRSASLIWTTCCRIIAPWHRRAARCRRGKIRSPDQASYRVACWCAALSGAAKLYGGDCFTGGFSSLAGNGLYPGFDEDV